MSMPNARTPRFTGWHMLAIMVTFFGVIISVTVTMAVMASRSWTGLIVKNSYVASQHFNEALHDARAQRERGWTSTLGYEDGVLTARLMGREGDVLAVEDARLELGRTAFEKNDRSLPLVYQGTGVYSARLDLAPGKWRVSVHMQHDGAPYRRDVLIYISANGKGRIE